MTDHLHPKYGWGWRTKNRRLQKYVTITMEDQVNGTPQEFFDRITATIENAGLTEAEVTMVEVSGSWGGEDHQEFAVKGWREATPEERAEVEARQTEIVDRHAQRKAAELAEAERVLREARPDLFAK